MTTTVDDLFIVHRARSALFDAHEPGDVPFISHGLADNGVIGSVTPLAADKVFRFRGIAISSFCEATCQVPPFIADGRSGNGVVVLEPREETSLGALAYVAAYVNAALRWKFSWYRQTTADRVKRLTLNLPIPLPPVDYRIGDLLPQTRTYESIAWKPRFAPFPLGSLYDPLPGYYHNASALEAGPIPLVSCKETNNGILSFVKVPQNRTYSGRLTVALNGQPLTAKYHPYRFAAKDDVAVCIPRRDLRLSTEIFIQSALNRERWRYSYYRKCYVEKLRRFPIHLPAKSGEVDEDAIEQIMPTARYWDFVRDRLSGWPQT